MECSKCRYGEYCTNYGGYYCRNPNTSRYNHLTRMEGFGCTLGEPVIDEPAIPVATASSASPTNLFTELKMELYSVVYKIDTDEGHRTKEYLVNATSQERALELAMNYFKNTAQFDESIVGDPIVHVLRKEGVVSSSQVGCY